ncbi:MAG: polysaccharide deacetylase family protein [Clostridia bacterium]|nr:polysaccharide deacetylase family protein [Clostridia bacterium]
MNKTYIRFPDFRRKALTLSYDDGMRQDKRLIAIMKQHGLKGTFNINGGVFGSQYDGQEVGRMTKEEALALYIPSGMEVAVHGYKHLSLPFVDIAVANNDVCADRRELEKTFGCIIKGMAYANGTFNDEVVDLLKKNGIKYSRTVRSTERFDMPSDWMRLPTTCHHKNPRLMELARQFVTMGEHCNYWHNAPKMFYLWGHSYEFDNDDNWCVIEEFAEYVGNREDIWYATNGEIFDYLTACDRLEFSIDATLVHNPSGMDVWIDCFGKKCMIPAGQTVSI